MKQQEVEVKALVRSMKKALKEQHGISVPHSALRASYLVAQGENPHAFKGNKEFSASTTSDNTALLRKSAQLVDANRESVIRTMYLAEDDIGCLSKLSLDAEGEIILPEWTTQCAVLLSQSADIPSVARYGLPDYLSNPQEFYGNLVNGMQVSSRYNLAYRDTNDDGGDSCAIEVSMTHTEWARVITLALGANGRFAANFREWLKIHHSDVVDGRLSQWDKANLVDHYLGEMSNRSLREVIFEWVYPDEDGDSVSAMLDLESGEILLNDAVPDDIWSSLVRVRIWDGEEVGDGDDYPVKAGKPGNSGAVSWTLSRKHLASFTS